MSNSPLVDYSRISPNRTSPRKNKIDTITIHCVVGQVTVERLGEIFAASSRAASSNYGIGLDGKIGLYVEEKDRSWCTGGKDKNGQPILVNGISGADNDHRAITIEVASDTTHPYAITDAAYKALVKLCADICKRNEIKSLKWKGDKSLVGKPDQQNMTVHRWFANKACPGDYIYNRLGQIADEVNAILKQEDDEMTQAEFNKMFATAMTSFRSSLQDNDASKYSEEARKWAMETGLVAGGSTDTFNGMWEDFLTREQLYTVLYRFAQMMGKA